MAYSDFYGNEVTDDGAMAKFNPAALKMARIDKINQLLNFCKLVPLSFNPDYNAWNFMLWFENVNNLFSEVQPKFSSEEREECKEYKVAISTCLNKYPITEYIKNKWTTPDESRWLIIKKYLEDYEEKVKEYQDKHGLDVPNAEDDEGL